MKQIVFFLFILITIILGAQNELTSASVDIDIKDSSHIEVKQTLVLDVPDSIQQIDLNLLKFEGISVSINEINSGESKIRFTKNDKKELQLITLLSKSKPFKTIELNYSVEIENESFYLPLFFTELASASSDNDFFKARIKMQKDQNMTLHFPNVDQIENETSNEKIITIQVPALPSLFRMELPPSGDISKVSVTTIVDWVVAFVFVLIGIIIWKKRDQLRYG